MSNKDDKISLTPKEKFALNMDIPTLRELIQIVLYGDIFEEPWDNLKPYVHMFNNKSPDINYEEWKNSIDPDDDEMRTKIAFAATMAKMLKDNLLARIKNGYRKAVNYYCKYGENSHDMIIGCCYGYTSITPECKQEILDLFHKYLHVYDDNPPFEMFLDILKKYDMDNALYILKI